MHALHQMNLADRPTTEFREGNGLNEFAKVAPMLSGWLHPTQGQMRLENPFLIVIADALCLLVDLSLKSSQ